jgi:hypothetical protein
MKVLLCAMPFVLASCTPAIEGKQDRSELKLDTTLVGKVEQQKDAGAEKKGGLRFDDTYMEKTWGIKFKSYKLDGGRLILLFQFTKDIDDATELRKALARFSGRPAKPGEATHFFYYFDKENVAITKFSPESVQGELSGKKGDAFRVSIPFSSGGDLSGTKLELRPVPPEKKVQ